MAGAVHVSMTTPRAWMGTYHWGCRVRISLKGELQNFLIKKKFIPNFKKWRSFLKPLSSLSAPLPRVPLHGMTNSPLYSVVRPFRIDQARGFLTLQ